MTASSVTDEHQAIPVPAAELLELRRDSARYRWLRDYGVMSDDGPWCCAFDEGSTSIPDYSPRDGEELDALVDLAIAKRDTANMAAGFNAALECTKDAVGRDGRGDPVGDPYEEATIARKAR